MPPVRYVGMTILAITVLKVFFYDLWELGGIYRVDRLPWLRHAARARVVSVSAAEKLRRNRRRPTLRSHDRPHNRTSGALAGRQAASSIATGSSRRRRTRHAVNRRQASASPVHTSTQPPADAQPGNQPVRPSPRAPQCGRTASRSAAAVPLASPLVGFPAQHAASRESTVSVDRAIGLMRCGRSS